MRGGGAAVGEAARQPRSQGGERAGMQGSEEARKRGGKPASQASGAPSNSEVLIVDSPLLWPVFLRAKGDAVTSITAWRDDEQSCSDPHPRNLLRNAMLLPIQSYLGPNNVVHMHTNDMSGSTHHFLLACLHTSNISV